MKNTLRFIRHPRSWRNLCTAALSPSCLSSITLIIARGNDGNNFSSCSKVQLLLGDCPPFSPSEEDDDEDKEEDEEEVRRERIPDDDSRVLGVIEDMGAVDELCLGETGDIEYKVELCCEALFDLTELRVFWNASLNVLAASSSTLFLSKIEDDEEDDEDDEEDDEEEDDDEEGKERGGTETGVKGRGDVEGDGGE